VIIPTRNRAEKLPAVVESLLYGEYEDVEIIIVDDASEDATLAICEQLRARDGRVCVIRLAKRSGAAVARNRGAREARGRFLLFSDDDVISHPGRVKRLCEALAEHPDAGMAYCWIECTDETGETEILGAGAWSATTSAVMLRREVFDQVGGFDERLPRMQDFDLWTRVLAVTRAIGVCEILGQMSRDSTGISRNSELLETAAGLLLDKYPRGSLPSRHLGEFHRRIAGKLVVGGGRLRTAFRHFLKAFHADPLNLRTPCAIGLLLCGRRIYEVVAAAINAGK